MNSNLQYDIQEDKLKIIENKNYCAGDYQITIALVIQINNEE